MVLPAVARVSGGLSPQSGFVGFGFGGAAWGPGGTGRWGPDGCDVTSYLASLRLDFSGFHVVPWSPDFVSLGSVPVRHYVCLIDHIDMVQLS